MERLAAVLFFCAFGPLQAPAEEPASFKLDSSTSYRDRKAKPYEEEASSLNTPAAAERSAASSSPGPVDKKIKEVFIGFLEILENKSIESKEYAKAVKFLEKSLYDEAGFESLKMLAAAYKDKKDFKNQIKVLKILSSKYSGAAESFYLLGAAYRDMYLNKEHLKERYPKDKDFAKARASIREKILENFNKAIKMNRKYKAAYQDLMNFLITENPETKEKLHTKGSLSIAMEMLNHLKKKEHYIDLCKAYYDNNFLKQSRRLCAISVRKNPKDPVSALFLALSLTDESNIHESLLAAADRFKNSFIVQYKTALYFQDKDPKISIRHFEKAHSIQPDNIHLNKMMAQFFFKNQEEEKSYSYFLNSCVMTDGKFLKPFRAAAAQLRRKKETAELSIKFQKGIKECYFKAKKNLKKKRKK